MAAYVVVLLVFAASEVASWKYGPLVIQPEAAARAYVFNVLTVSAVVGSGLYYFKNLSWRAREDLHIARQRVAELLENMLPPSIAARLEHGERTIAESHGDASVLFADLTGFSALTRRLAPTHLIEVLNSMFSRFDEAAGRLGIEKIKTIGDCYMAATGVLEQRAGQTGSDAMAEFALEMLGIVDDLTAELGLEPWGVCSGD